MKSCCAIVVIISMLPAATAAVEWTKFRDPVEGAFTLEVPAGWQVVGGIKRRSVNQPHPIVGMLSPDGLTKIVMGDPAAIAYGELAGQLIPLGFHEGQPTRRVASPRSSKITAPAPSGLPNWRSMSSSRMTARISK